MLSAARHTSSLAALTARERDVLALMAEGHRRVLAVLAYLGS